MKVGGTHGLLSEITARGLEKALDGWEQASEVQTHFVLLDFTGGLYRLQARVHDGMTGQAAAMLRRGETGDRGGVPLLAARLGAHGIGPGGNASAARKDGARTLHGGGLGGPLRPRVQAGDRCA